MTIVVIIGFILFLVGMAVSVWAFGTGGKRANVFKDIYFSIEDVDGVGVLYTKTGEYSAILKMENPVQKYSADTDCYYDFTNLMTALTPAPKGYEPYLMNHYGRHGSRGVSIPFVVVSITLFNCLGAV